MADEAGDDADRAVGVGPEAGGAEELSAEARISFLLTPAHSAADTSSNCRGVLCAVSEARAAVACLREPLRGLLHRCGLSFVQLMLFDLPV